MTPEQFTEGVLRTAASDRFAIIERMQANDKVDVLHLFHASLALSGELAELDAATDKVNVLEELGDALWYCVLAYYSIGVQFQLPEDYAPPVLLFVGYTTDEFEDCFLGAVHDLLDQIGVLQDVVKKWIFYAEVFSRSAVVRILDEILLLICQQIVLHGGTPEKVMYTNQAKLRVRFPDKFTEACAQTRDLVKERAVLEGGVSYEE